MSASATPPTPPTPLAPTLGHETPHEVMLVRRLRDAITSLNPGLTPEAREAAIEQITRDRSALDPVSF